jgi:hypothetical protein
MAASHVVAGREVADGAIDELYVELHVRPDRAARALLAEGVHAGDIAAEVAHDVDRVGVEGLDHVVWRTLVRVVDPHLHVEEQMLADEAVVLPFLGDPGGGREAMVEIDAEATFVPLGALDHLDGLGDGVADGLLADHVAPGFQCLDGGLVVIAAVFVAAGGDAADVRLDGGQHAGDVVVGGDAQAGGGGIGAVFLDVTDSNQLGQAEVLMDVRVAVPDGPAANHSDSQRHGLLLEDWRNGTVE